MNRSLEPVVEALEGAAYRLGAVSGDPSPSLESHRASMRAALDEARRTILRTTRQCAADGCTRVVSLRVRWGSVSMLVCLDCANAIVVRVSEGLTVHPRDEGDR